MKKGILLMSALAFMAGTTEAQIRFAPELGLNISKLRYEDNTGNDYTTEWKFGPKVGALVEIPITDKIAFAPGIQYSMKGGERDWDTETTVGSVTTKMETKSKLTMHYVEVPLNFNFHLKPIGEGGLFFNVGPYLAYAAGGGYATDMKTSVSSGSSTIETENTSDGKLKIGNTPTDDIKSFDMGANIGIGYELPMGLFFRGQFGMSILDVATDKIGDPSMRNNTLGFSVGYFLGGN